MRSDLIASILARYLFDTRFRCDWAVAIAKPASSGEKAKPLVPAGLAALLFEQAGLRI
jgi:hypothetical protein